MKFYVKVQVTGTTTFHRNLINGVWSDNTELHDPLKYKEDNDDDKIRLEFARIYNNIFISASKDFKVAAA